MVTVSNSVRIRSSVLVAHTCGRSMAAHTSTAANAQPRRPETISCTDPDVTKTTTPSTHRPSPMAPVTRPLVARKRVTSSATCCLLLLRSGPATCGFRTLDPQLYAWQGDEHSREDDPPG